jgi:predicted metal-dependent HD superfamily phosphohydrolase
VRDQILDDPFAGKSAAARHYHSLGHALSPLQFIKPSGFAAPLITPLAS